MTSVASYSASGSKSTAKVTLDKSIFGLKVEDHRLLRMAYQTYLDNGRQNLAKTKTRGEVRGGGAKPWKQKGTGRARHGSRRSPIWTGGGITFGPLGNENYSKKINVKAKRLALRQALSLIASEGKLKVISELDCKSGKVKQVKELLDKIQAEGNVLLVVSQKDDSINRATRNLVKVNVVQANYLTVYDLLNSDNLVITKKSLEIVSDWLSAKAKPKKTEDKS